MSPRREIRFLLNDREVTLAPGCSRTLLDELRVQRRMTGTKEGCAEGDCGACTVLVGRLTPEGLRYETVNSCIRLIGSLDACHVVTIEHLHRDGRLHPVQQAMVDHHGSQCGFCTPGIVMSLYALWMSDPNPDDAAVDTALQGNLCRCTGYAPIVRAAKAAAKVSSRNDPLMLEREAVATKLAALRDGRRVEFEANGETTILPADLDDLAQVLSGHEAPTIVSGMTDVGLWVAKHMRPISPAVFIGHLHELQGVEEDGDGVTIGAGVTYSEFEAVVARRFPQMRELWHRIGGGQVRNMGTIGGNIANGSPIGDTPPGFIALGATVTLQSVDGTREVPLEEFFIEYGKQDRAAGEFVRSVRVPYPADDAVFSVHKLSKRREEDISTLCGAFHVRLDGETVREARICYGGMAGTPARARNAERALEGNRFDEENVQRAMKALEDDYEPMSDQRASAAYRMRAAQNLLMRVLLDHRGEPAELRRAA